MRVTVTESHSGDAVVIAVSSDSAVAFLCRSLVTGSAFDRYSALIFDLRASAPLSAKTREMIDAAVRSRLHRHQWLGVVGPGESIGTAVAQARRWHHVVGETGSATNATLRVAGDLLAELVQGAAGTARRAGARAFAGMSGRP